jgi:hypothetical protein
MQFLKYNTAATVTMGPFVDKGDGVTPETGLAAGTVDEIGVYKHDATALTDISGTTTFTHRAGGMYTMTLSTSDTNTVGRMTAYVRDDSVCLPVWKDFMVLPANVYDSFVAGSDYMQVDAVEISGDSTAADNCELFFDGNGYDATANSMNVTQIEGADATDTLDARVDARLQAINLDHLMSAACPGNDVNNAVVDNSVVAFLAAIGADISDYSGATDSLEALGTGAGFADAVWDEQLSGHTTAGSAGEAQAGSRTADYVWDETIEANANVTAQTARQILRIIAAALAGADADEGDWSCLSIDGSKTRISGTLDASGARLTVDTLDGS